MKKGLKEMEDFVYIGNFEKSYTEMWIRFICFVCKFQWSNGYKISSKCIRVVLCLGSIYIMNEMKCPVL